MGGRPATPTKKPNSYVRLFCLRNRSEVLFIDLKLKKKIKNIAFKTMLDSLEYSVNAPNLPKKFDICSGGAQQK